MTRPAPSPERAALYLAALATPQLGVTTLLRLLEALGGIEAVANASASRLARVAGVRAAVAAELHPTLRREERRARAAVASALAGGLSVHAWEDASFPRVLRDDPSGSALLLFVEGRLPPQLDRSSRWARSCAVVGTRRASAGGRGFARDLARAAAREGLVVVSGLALGIDGAAHEGALDAAAAADGAGAAPGWSRPRYRWAPAADGAREPFPPGPAPTVAVLGGGHGRLHPAAHAGLARRILAAGGAVVSQWPPDTQPTQKSFLHRNRVISGLARAVVVVEAGLRSGAHNTVAHALQQGRTVLAVPAAPWSATGAGCVRLLREGASPLASEDDLFAEFAELAPRPAATAADAPGPDPHAGTGHGPTSAVSQGELPLGLTPVERVRRALAGAGELSLDALLAEVQLSPGALVGLLARLELEGEVSATPGGRYRLRGA